MSDQQHNCLNPTCPNQGASLSRCSGCNCVSYCGRDCQVAMWKHHKHICKGIGKNIVKEEKTKKTVLIIDGMGPLGRDDISTQPIVDALEARGIPSANIHIDKGKCIPEQLALILNKKASTIRVCIILGWGSGDSDDDDGYCRCNTHAGFRQALVDWVTTSGGTLIVQGERIAHAAGNWPTWFGLTWKSSDYSRTVHVRNDHHWAMPWFSSQPAAPTEIDAKSCMIDQVEKNDILFGTTSDSKTYSLVPGFGGKDVKPNQSTFAMAQCGKGVVAFSGDINAENTTIATIAIICQHQVSL